MIVKKRGTDSRITGCQSFTFLRWYTKMKKTIENGREILEKIPGKHFDSVLPEKDGNVYERKN